MVNRYYYMSNLHNFQGMVMKMASYLHHVTQSSHKNKQQWAQRIQASVMKVPLIHHL